jgi:hypothetical protein
MIDHDEQGKRKAKVIKSGRSIVRCEAVLQ